MRQDSWSRSAALVAFLTTMIGGAPLIGQAPDEPDPLELRRVLVDEIEAAYTRGDLETLEQMESMTPRRALTPQRASAALREATDVLTRVVGSERPAEASSGRPESVASAFSPWSIFDLVDYLCAYNQNQRLAACDVGHSLCLTNLNATPLRPNDGCSGTGATPGRDCVQPVTPGDGYSTCFMDHALCKLDVYENPGFGCSQVTIGPEVPVDRTIPN